MPAGSSGALRTPYGAVVTGLVKALVPLGTTPVRSVVVLMPSALPLTSSKGV